MLDIKIDNKFETDFTFITIDKDNISQQNVVLVGTQKGDFLLNPEFGVYLTEVFNNDILLQKFVLDTNNQLINTSIKFLENKKGELELYIQESIDG